MNDLLTYVCIRINIGCNLSCRHCRSGSNPTLKDEVDYDLTLKFVDKLMLIGLNHVNLTGGEPTMYSKFSLLINSLLDRGLFVTITTNGLANYNKILKNIHPFKLRKLRVRVSLDGAKPLHEFLRGENSYNRTIKNLRIISGIGCWIAVNTVVYSSTLPSIPDLFEDIKNIDLDEWAIITPVPSKNTVDDPTEFGRFREVHISNLNKAEKLILELGFTAKIHKIDFYSNPNAYLFVDELGLVSLPEATGLNDIKLGHITNIDLSYLSDQINLAISNNSKTYFTW